MMRGDSSHRAICASCRTFQAWQSISNCATLTGGKRFCAGEVAQAVGGLETSIHALIERHACERPEHPFIECIDTGRSLSFAAARDISGRIAARCADRGIAANDRVAIMGGNSLEDLILYLGILRHGATLCSSGQRIWNCISETAARRQAVEFRLRAKSSSPRPAAET
jgi:hypothetical protein